MTTADMWFDQEAGRLWDGVLLVSGTDGFFELKRGRTRRPIERWPAATA